MISLLFALLFQITAAQKMRVSGAATKLMPGVTWIKTSVVSADFTCRGRREYSILGIVKSEAIGTYMLVGVFLDGLDKQPEIIRYSARNPMSIELAQHPLSVNLIVEDLDYDPGEFSGQPTPEGFERSKTCKGFKIDDGERDSLHLYYWNHVDHLFDSWSL